MPPDRSGIARPTVGSAEWIDRLSGAPLDAIKVVAAILMVGDHVDTILLDGNAVPLWRLGRIAFPLFCLVTAVHLARGADPGRYVLALMLSAFPTQPIYAAAFPYGTTEGSILFTLAAGTALAVGLERASGLIRHGAFALGLGLVFVGPQLAKTAVDFGLAGILLIPAIRLTIAQPRIYGAWLAAVIVGLNWHGWHPRGEEPVLSAVYDALTIAVGASAIVGLAMVLRERSRFLPRYALQVFYPLHLLILAVLRAAGIGVQP